MARRLRLASGFSLIVDDGVLWLVAGEDVRYRLGVRDPRAVRDLLARCDGCTVDELVARAPAELRADARQIVERLASERVLVEAAASAAHVAAPPGYRVVGTGALADALRADGGDGPIVLVQDRLDHAALLAHNAAMLAARQRWLWITTGPGTRAYVGPLFVPDAGPCAACLLVHFKRLSPVPALYDALLAHAETGGAIAPSAFPDAALATTAALARWKLSLVGEPVAPAALYALHVVEVGALAVSTHPPLADPECTACR